MTSAQRSTCGGFVAIVLWSTTVALARSLSEQLGPLTSAAAVNLLAGVLGLARLAVMGSPIREPVRSSKRYLLGCGTLFGLYALFLYLALGLARNRDEVLQVGLLNYLWPALTILLSLGILGHRARAWIVPGTALALSGIVLVLAPSGHDGSLAGAVLRWRSNPAAFTLATGAALVWALYSNLARRWSSPGQHGAVELFLLGAGLLLLLLRCTTTEATRWSGRAGLEIAVLASLTVVAYGLWEAAMRGGDLLLVAAASYLTPLLSTLVSAAYLHVVPGPRVWTGAGLLVIGSVLSWASTQPRPAPTPATEDDSEPRRP